MVNPNPINTNISPNNSAQCIHSRASTTNSNLSIKQQRHLSLQQSQASSPISHRYSSLLSSNSMKNMNITNPTNGNNLDVIKLIENYAFKNKGIFKSRNIAWSNHTNVNNYDSIPWKNSDLEISSNGSLLADNLILIKHLQQCRINLNSRQFLIKIATTSSNGLLFKFGDVYKYIEFLSCLIIWKKLKSSGLESKLNYVEPFNYIDSHLKDDLKSTAFQVYGPLMNTDNSSDFSYEWSKYTGHLLPTGVLNLFKDDQNEIIFSIDLTKHFNFEIQIVNNSISEGGDNVLYIGIINELRLNQDAADTRKSILKGISINCENILIDFNTSDELKNWYTNILKFTSQEYLETITTPPDKETRLNRYMKLEIIDAQFNDDSLINSFLFCELIIWNKVWFRTSVVKVDDKLNVFWKDSIGMDIPMSCMDSNFKIVIKKGMASNGDDAGDDNEFEDAEIIGFLMLNLDVTRNEICKFQILNLQNKRIGELMINLNMKTTYMLPNSQYKNFENILKNISIESVIKQIETKVTSNNLEYYSTILINIFEKMDRIDAFFDILIKYEFNKLHKMRLNNQQFGVKFNGLFRGNSILSKSLEIYTLRIGTPYLQSLLKEFIEQIIRENLNCEAAEAEADAEAEAEAEAEGDGDGEKGKEVDEDDNEASDNLLKYIEMLWNKVYNSSNDIPIQIKKQWKSLRLNIELLNNDKSYLYNGLNSFIFLRFLCPSILNPKLYNILNVKYNDKVQNTLNLISKTIMIFSMRLKFQKHKDPELIKFNEDFLVKYDNEIVEFLDNVTLKKLDFHEKIFDLEDVKVYDFESYEYDLPPSFDLINKYLNYSQLVEVLKTETPTMEHEDEKKVGIEDYQIKGFEINDDEDFLTSIIRDEDNEILSGLINNKGEKFNIEDLINESNSIFLETNQLVKQLNDYEVPELYMKNGDIEQFMQEIIKSMNLDHEEVVFNDDDGYQDIASFINLIVKENNRPKATTIKLSSSSPSISNPKSSTSPTSGSTPTANRRSIFKNIFRRKSAIQ